MSVTNIFALRSHNTDRKLLSVLVDPDKVDDESLRKYTVLGNNHDLDLWLVGGSQMRLEKLAHCIKYLKKHSDVPVVLFPGSHLQVDSQADAILFLSLLSGSNSDFLVGHQKKAARKIQASKMKVIPTAYILIDGGRSSSAAKFSGTEAIPMDQEELILETVLTGMFFGMNTIYLEAGSGAKNNIEPDLVKKVKALGNFTLIVGGGIREMSTAEKLWKSGADIIVVGNILEKHPDMIPDFIKARNSCR